MANRFKPGFTSSMAFFALSALLCVVMSANRVHAQQQDEVKLDARVMHISSELRCLVCQNQTVAESNATLAVDFRKQIREMIAAGKSDEDITRFMVDRYGDFVLYRPPVKSSTLLLWLGPLLFAVLAGAIVLMRLSRRRSDALPLPAADLARADALLADGKGGKS